jgi:hypothetical protein
MLPPTNAPAMPVRTEKGACERIMFACAFNSRGRNASIAKGSRYRDALVCPEEL